MKYLRQFSWIILVSFLGEVLHFVLPLPIPASVYGLVLMLVLLMTKVISLDKVEAVSDWMMSIMPLFFMPATVALIESFGAMKGQVLAILGICFISTVVVTIVTGWVAQLLIGITEKREEK